MKKIKRILGKIKKIWAFIITEPYTAAMFFSALPALMATILFYFLYFQKVNSNLETLDYIGESVAQTFFIFFVVWFICFLYTGALFEKFKKKS